MPTRTGFIEKSLRKKNHQNDYGFYDFVVVVRSSMRMFENPCSDRDYINP